MMNSGSLPTADARPVGVRLAAARGAPILVAGMPVTPVARRLMVWWPGGGWLYAWPDAIEYPDGQRTRRVRIVPVRSLAMGGLVALVVVAVVASAAQWWSSGRRNAAQSMQSMQSTRMRR